MGTNFLQRLRPASLQLFDDLWGDMILLIKLKNLDILNPAQPFGECCLIKRENNRVC
jgi:hypothetical protein